MVLARLLGSDVNGASRNDAVEKALPLADSAPLCDLVITTAGLKIRRDLYSLIKKNRGTRKK
jgi:hypothetical protein